MPGKAIILQRTRVIALFAVLCLLLFAATTGHFRHNDFFQLGTHLFRVMENPATVITESEAIGFLLVGVFFLSLPSLLSGRVQFDKQGLRLTVLGMFFALITISPFLFLNWTSPTWLYLPVFGTTLSVAVLFQRVVVNAPDRRSGLLFFIDKEYHTQYGINGLFRSRGNLGGALRIWYDDPTRSAYIEDQDSSVEALSQE